MACVSARTSAPANVDVAAPFEQHGGRRWAGEHVQAQCAIRICAEGARLRWPLRKLHSNATEARETPTLGTGAREDVGACSPWARAFSRSTSRSRTTAVTLDELIQSKQASPG